MGEKVFSKVGPARRAIKKANEHLVALTAELEAAQKRLDSQYAEIVGGLQVSQKVDMTQVTAFRKKPYALLPKRMGKHGKVLEYLVIVPCFVNFYLPQLHMTDSSYNYFLLNSYTHHFGEIPVPLRHVFKLSPIPDLKVVNGMLLTPEDRQEDAWKHFRKHLVRREGSSAIRIKRNHEFYVIAEIIESGGLPFIPNKVDKEDVRKNPATTIELRDYQQKAFKTFLETGAVGVFWPYSVGKTFFGNFLCAAIRGPKVVFVPNLTLKEKWTADLIENTSIAEEVRVETYHSFHKVKNHKYVLAVFEECHHLPAKSFIKLALLKTKYRVGFSASPFREDGRTDYIMALTGYPVGLDWEKFAELGLITKPKVTVFLVKGLAAKMRKLEELLGMDLGKTLIFCDGLGLGKRVANMFDVEHVWGETKNRIDVVEQNDVVVVSRVGDEGISVKDLDTIIEIDFLFGSRMQEGQRSGRLLHSTKGSKNHFILMTEDELNKYGKRLYALYEKNFEVNIQRA